MGTVKNNSIYNENEPGTSTQDYDSLDQNDSLTDINIVSERKDAKI
jgi:hypothetical protein